MRLGPLSASTRINPRIPVDAWIADAHGARARVCDVSLGGALLAAENPGPLDATGALELHLHDMRVAVSARVAWHQTDADTGLSTYGVEFTGMSSNASHALRRAVKHVQAHAVEAPRWRAVVVDSSAARLVVTTSRLELVGFAVWPARTPLAAVDALVSAPPFDAVVVGRQLSSVDGTAFLDFVAGEWPQMKRVRIAWGDVTPDPHGSACLAEPWDCAALRAAAAPT